MPRRCRPARSSPTPTPPWPRPCSGAWRRLLELAAWLHARTGDRDLVLAGGVALNCVANSRLWREGPFERVWVQPAAGDSGTALGARLGGLLPQRSNRYGWLTVIHQSPDRLGLISLDGTIVAPRPYRPWRPGAECRR
jgi:hypothetical protein